jgi:ABC-2 type transport system permease protein
MLARQLIHVDWVRFLRSRTWEAISFLPPGLAARSIAAAGRGELPVALGFLLGLLVCSAATVYLAGWLIERVYAGEVISPIRQRRGVSGQGSEKTRPAPRTLTPGPRPQTPSFLRLPPVVEAVVEKEVKYILRDPYFKIALMNLVYLLLVVGFTMLGRRGDGELQGVRPGLIWGATGWVLLSEMQLLFNLFGTDGAAAAVLFLYPSSRRQMLIGKNLTLFAALSVVNLTLVLILTAFGGALAMFGPLFCWMELALAVFVAIGNVVSIWFPVRVVLQGWRIRQQSASRGCGYSFLYLGVAVLAFLLLLPVLGALLTPTFWVEPVWYALSIPVAIAYAAGLYLLSLRLAEPLLLERERVMIDRLGQTE